MFKFIAIAIAVLIAAVLIYATTRPDTFSVQRTETIKAPPDKIFPLINDFHSWPSWSPWEKLDPAMQRTLSGAASGPGAVYEWSGNKQVGSGRMEVTGDVVASKVTIKLDFFTPFEGHNTVEFTLEAQGDSTLVSHAVFGPSPYISKLMGIFFNMDKMIGDKFEEGLHSLKAIAEA